MADVRARAEVDLGAVRHNCAHLKAVVNAGTELCAVVKADGYGHGAESVATAALAAGASRLAVATASEAAALAPRHPGTPLLVLGALSAVEVEHAADPALDLQGIWTHFATADELGDEFFGTQLERFTRVATAVQGEFPETIRHAANSAATLRDPRAHFDMVRCGVAIYGLDPFQRDPARHGLRPALALRSYVADVKRIPAGASVGYGRSWVATEDTWVALVPIGYGDGYRRALSDRAEVLVRGHRRPVVGTISMDNLTISLGRETSVQPGEEVVLLGRQGEDSIGSEELARRLGTINYEVCCGISGRVPRRVR